MVKQFLADRARPASGSRHLPQAAAVATTFTAVDRPVAPTEAEADANPRARSARLRAATRTEAPARADHPFDFARLPDLPAAGKGQP